MFQTEYPRIPVLLESTENSQIPRESIYFATSRQRLVKRQQLQRVDGQCLPHYNSLPPMPTISTNGRQLELLLSTITTLSADRAVWCGVVRLGWQHCFRQRVVVACQHSVTPADEVLQVG
ncbi:hypothetical protein J6590_082177 [Homalodisca vitripennis]|nr:hypothetical protein J6590_082177 [Homalodisca vitripennis]